MPATRDIVARYFPHSARFAPHWALPCPIVASPPGLDLASPPVMTFCLFPTIAPFYLFHPLPHHPTSFFFSPSPSLFLFLHILFFYSSPLSLLLSHTHSLAVAVFFLFVTFYFILLITIFFLLLLLYFLWFLRRSQLLPPISFFLHQFFILHYFIALSRSRSRFLTLRRPFSPAFIVLIFLIRFHLLFLSHSLSHYHACYRPLSSLLFSSFVSLSQRAA